MAPAGRRAATTPAHHPPPDPTRLHSTRRCPMNRPHVLLVADWTVDPYAVLAEAQRRRRERPATAFGTLVPAWLHGLDWTGDPGASVPCACRQLAAIGELAAAAGLLVETAVVGD